MNIIITGRQMNLTEAMKDSVELKLERLEKYFNDEVSPKVTVSNSKNKTKVEVTIPVKGTVIRAQSVDYDFYSTVDEVVNKLGRQLRKHRTKLMNKGHDSIRFENIELIENQESQSHGIIVKRKTFDYTPMSEEEAILQMEMLDHTFFIFTNSANDKISVLYKRDDDNYGIIEQE